MHREVDGFGLELHEKITHGAANAIAKVKALCPRSVDMSHSNDRPAACLASASAGMMMRTAFTTRPATSGGHGAAAAAR